MDSEATSVRWEVVSEDDKTLSLSGKSGSGLQSLSKTAKATKQAQAKASSSNVLEAGELLTLQISVLLGMSLMSTYGVVTVMIVASQCVQRSTKYLVN